MAEHQVSVEDGYVPPQDHIFAHLKSGANHNAVGDYSSTVTSFTFTPANGRKAAIHRMLVFVEDAGAFVAEKYGYNLALTNGLKLVVRDADDAIILTLTPDENIISNADWSGSCFDVTYIDWGVGNNSMGVRWTFAKSGKPLYLDGRLGHYLSMELNDTFTGLVHHHFQIQGFYVK